MDAFFTRRVALDAGWSDRFRRAKLRGESPLWFVNWLPVTSREMSLPSFPVITNCACIGIAQGSFSDRRPGRGDVGVGHSGVNAKILVVEGQQILNGAGGRDGERLGRKGASALGPGERERVARVKQRRRGIVHRRDPVGKQIVFGCGRGSTRAMTRVTSPLVRILAPAATAPEAFRFPSMVASVVGVDSELAPSGIVMLDSCPGTMVPLTCWAASKP